MSDAARTRLISFALLIVVFASGAVVGAAMKSTIGASEPIGEVAVRDGSESDQDDDDDGRRRTPMWELVGPSDQQRAAIDSVLGHHRSSMNILQSQFRSAYNPRYWAIVDSTRASIRAVLQPAQAVQYDSLIGAYDDRKRDGDSGNRFP